MMLRWLACAALAAALMQGTAVAQSTSSSTDSAKMETSAQSLPQELKQKLQDQGFSDVKIVPGSFIVSAKDKQGDPVTMVIGPNSLTMFSYTTSESDSTTGSGSQSNRQDNK